MRAIAYHIGLQYRCKEWVTPFIRRTGSGQNIAEKTHQGACGKGRPIPGSCGWGTAI